MCFSYIWSKMLYSSSYTMLKLSKTTSPNKLFDNDCVTQYMNFCMHKVYIHLWAISYEKKEFIRYIFVFLTRVSHEIKA